MIAVRRMLSQTVQHTLPRSSICLESFRLNCGKRRLAHPTWVALAEGPRDLEPPDVRKLAKLAQIRVTDEEVRFMNAR